MADCKIKLRADSTGLLGEEHAPETHLTMDAKQRVETLQLIARRTAIPIHFNDYTVMKSSLEDFMKNVWCQCEKFTFDYHDDRLIDFLRRVIEKQTYKEVRS